MVSGGPDHSTRIEWNICTVGPLEASVKRSFPHLQRSTKSAQVESSLSLMPLGWESGVLLENRQERPLSEPRNTQSSPIPGSGE
jgi:hypothetical protein